MKTCKKCKQMFSVDDFVSKGKERERCSSCRRKHVDAVTRCREAKQKVVYDYKRQKGCVVCGFDEPVALSFHHLDPSKKDDTIANLFVNNAPLNKVFAEIEKCVVICANHHMMLHAGLITL